MILSHAPLFRAAVIIEPKSNECGTIEIEMVRSNSIGLPRKFVKKVKKKPAHLWVCFLIESASTGQEIFEISVD